MGFWDAFQLHPNQSAPQGGGMIGGMVSQAMQPLPDYNSLYTSLSQLGQKGGFLGGMVKSALGTGVTDQNSGLYQAYAKRQATQQALQQVLNPATGRTHLIPQDQVPAAQQAGGLIQAPSSQPSYADFQRDYWAPDRDQVLASMAPPAGGKVVS